MSGLDTGRERRVTKTLSRRQFVADLLYSAPVNWVSEGGGEVEGGWFTQIETSAPTETEVSE